MYARAPSDVFDSDVICLFYSGWKQESWCPFLSMPMQAESTVFPLVQFTFWIACIPFNGCVLEVSCCAKSGSE